MKTEKLTVQQAVEQGRELPFVLIRSLSSIYIGRIREIGSMDELLEARFFGEDQEIRIFHKGEELAAVCLKKEASDRELMEKFAVANERFGKSITVCSTLEADEDGQSYVAQKRLTHWEGGKQDE